MSYQDLNLIRQALLIKALQPDTSVRALAKQLGVSRYFIDMLQERLEKLQLTAQQGAALDDDAFAEAFDFSSSRKGDFIEPNWQEIWDFMNPGDVKSTQRQKPMLSVAWQSLYVDRMFPAGTPLPKTCMSIRTFERRYHNYCEMHQKPDSSPFPSLNFSRGELMEIDTIGDHFRFVQPDGNVCRVKLFTAVLKYSGLIFAEAVEQTTTRMWLKCLGDAFEYFGGVPKTVRSDNDVAIVNHGRKGKSLTVPKPAYAALLRAYGAAYDLAPVRRPTYKAAVERTNGILIQKLFSDRTDAVKALDLNDYNRQIRTEIDHLNLAPRSGSQISRRACFELYERECLQALPALRPQIRDLTSVVVGADGYVRYENNYNYAGKGIRNVELEVVNGCSLEIREGGRPLGLAKRIAVYEICHEIFPTPRRFKAKKLCSAEERAVTRNKEWYIKSLGSLSKSHVSISEFLDLIWKNGDENNPLAVKRSNALLRLIRLSDGRDEGVTALDFACAEAIRQKRETDFVFVESLFKTLLELKQAGVVLESVPSLHHSPKNSPAQHVDGKASSLTDTDDCNVRGEKYYAKLCGE